MVQRSRTFVLPSENFAKVTSKSYNADIETHVADRAAYSMPNVVARLMSRKVLHTIADEEPERFDALERAGFRCERHGDVQWHLLESFGGQYGDVGYSKLIADSKIKMISGPAIIRFTPDGLALSDGTELSADVVVLCTGLVGNMCVNIEKIFSKEVANEVGDI